MSARRKLIDGRRVSRGRSGLCGSPEPWRSRGSVGKREAGNEGFTGATRLIQAEVGLSLRH
jgi:hypothetical protein